MNSDEYDLSGHAKSDPGANSPLWEWMDQLKTNNTLVRLSVVKGKGVRFSIPGRILGYDSAAEMLTVYHVDEKKVYLLKLNEIDDFIPC